MENVEEKKTHYILYIIGMNGEFRIKYANNCPNEDVKRLDRRCFWLQILSFFLPFLLREAYSKKN